MPGSKSVLTLKQEKLVEAEEHQKISKYKRVFWGLEHCLEIKLPDGCNDIIWWDDQVNTGDSFVKKSKREKRSQKCGLNEYLENI